MQIKVSYELAGGTAEIEGTLSKEDVEFLVEYGLYHAIKNGVVPVTAVEQPEPIVMPGNGTVN